MGGASGADKVGSGADSGGGSDHDLGRVSGTVIADLRLDICGGLRRDDKDLGLRAEDEDLGLRTEVDEGLDLATEVDKDLDLTAAGLGFDDGDLDTDVGLG